MIKRILLSVILVVGGTWFVRTYLFEAVVVATGSMEPTLDPGTHYLVNKWTYRFHPVQRGDIVVLNSPVDADEGLIKRVIAVPGDTIELRQKQVYLNGSYLSEPYVIHKRPHERLVGDTVGPLVVPPEQVFVLGDDRDESEDSSVWKDHHTGEHIYFIPIHSIEGRVMRP